MKTNSFFFQFLSLFLLYLFYVRSCVLLIRANANGFSPPPPTTHLNTSHQPIHQSSNPWPNVWINFWKNDQKQFQLNWMVSHSTDLKCSVFFLSYQEFKKICTVLNSQVFNPQALNQAASLNLTPKSRFVNPLN